MTSKTIFSALFATLAILAATPPAFAAGTGDFFIAIRNDNPDQVIDQLHAGIDPNAADETGEPALVSALRYKSYRVADVLMRQPGIELDRRSARGETALMLAAHWGNKDFVEKLLVRGVQPNKPGWTALHYAASEGYPEIVRLLLDRGAAVDAESPAKITPLMMAARRGHAEICQLLLNRGADPSRADDAGSTAADFATRSNEADLSKELTRVAQARATKP